MLWLLSDCELSLVAEMLLELLLDWLDELSDENELVLDDTDVTEDELRKLLLLSDDSLTELETELIDDRLLCDETELLDFDEWLETDCEDWLGVEEELLLWLDPL